MSPPSSVRPRRSAAVKVSAATAVAVPFCEEELSSPEEFERLNRRLSRCPSAVKNSVAKKKKVARRRKIDPTTSNREYTSDEVEFMNALNDYKRSSGRMFPTCCEILEVVKGLGYEKFTAAIT